MQLEDWLDDLCVRFIINLPPEELESVERICFQVEEAQWFYEDFIRPLDPSLPSLSLRAFSLRIFQHCPLFSQWSAQHHTTAFAEFLAYKSRVPVRGAIMLNEAMDEVVLVKGWKKSANWSFPRGKINKDENDLDCAIREVYEETGFDIRAAGLVKDEKDMKYIEVTMREQHMRLYVFRGVSKDAHFEPKTRKEISKIEWYKLTDLPTLKKSRQQDGSGTDQPILNANKFYMVAPFLNPLKKWIAQQRKKENRYSSHLAAPPIVAEEVTTEEEQDVGGRHPFAPSDLPEVSAPTVPDPTAHLKEILNIGSVPPPPNQSALQPSHMPQVDAAKSNALLALLRGDSQVQARPLVQTPLEHITAPPEVQRSPHVSHVRPQQIDHTQPPPPFQSQLPAGTVPFHSRPGQPGPGAHQGMYNGRPSAPVAPYQRTGDLLISRQGPAQDNVSMVPPASALPTLTNHTKALLDVFKAKPAVAQPQDAGLSRPLPALLEHFKAGPTGSPSISPTNQGQPTGSALPAPNMALRSSTNQYPQAPVPLRSARSPENAQQMSLLEIFKRSSTIKAVDSTPSQSLPPAELAATVADPPIQKPDADKDDLLLSLLRQGGQDTTRRHMDVPRPSPREGETSATVNGPLNQPEFEVIAKTTKHVPTEMGRSALTTNRKLYDPNQPTPMKVLARPEEPRQQAPRSPRSLKTPAKRQGREKALPKEHVKPFQPQILRRPQTGEATEYSTSAVRSEGADPLATTTSAASPSPSRSVEAGERPISSRKPSQTEAQRQTLLSLFGGGGEESTPKATMIQPGSGIVSPLSASQILSAGNEFPLSSTEPISTRTSRVGSLASIVSGSAPGRAPAEKRQTGAENKAFLLGVFGQDCEPRELTRNRKRRIKEVSGYDLDC